MKKWGTENMIVDRYYYHQLNRQEQAIYKAFYDGVMAHQDVIPIPVRGKLKQETFRRIFMAVTRDNPLIYYLNQSSCSSAQDRFGHVAICPQYFFSQPKVKEYNRKIEIAVNQIIWELKLTEGNDYEKELRVHDWFCRNVSYDAEGSNLDRISRVIASHNIFGVFAYHKAQCEGIAKAVKVLLNAVDVRCMVVFGKAKKNRQMESHAWNLVNIEGRSYHLDVTWDLSEISKQSDRIYYDYFNLTDTVITQNHKADTLLPQCSAKDGNYYVRNHISFQNQRRLLKYVETLINQGKREFSFRVEGRLRAEKAASDVAEFLKIKWKERGNQSIRIRQISNHATGTCWIEIL